MIYAKKGSAEPTNSARILHYSVNVREQQTLNSYRLTIIFLINQVSLIGSKKHMDRNFKRELENCNW